MATSPVEICNWALTEIGASRIVALSENSRAAILANEQYDKHRKALLSSHPWNFASTRVQLALTVNTPVYGFEKEFGLPLDCLRVWDTDLPEELEWVVETNYTTGNRVLLCDSAEVRARIIRDITDTTKFSPHFEKALAMTMAASWAYIITNSTTMKDQMERIARLAVAEARSFDSQENGRQIFEANDWVNSRY